MELANINTMQYYISSPEENKVQCYRSSLSGFLTIQPDLVLAPSVVPIYNLVTGCLSVGPEVLALASLAGLTTLPENGTDPGFDTLPLLGIGFTLGLGKGVKVMDEGRMSRLLCETMVPDTVSIRYMLDHIGTQLFCPQAKTLTYGHNT